MDDRRRQLLFAVMEDECTNQKMLYAMHHVNNLVRADDCLMWCLRNGLVGKRFLLFVETFEGSVFSAMSDILRRVHRERKHHGIIAGKDYVDNVINFRSLGGKK